MESPDSRADPNSGKYTQQFDKAYGVVTGDHAKVEQHIHPPPPEPERGLAKADTPPNPSRRRLIKIGAALGGVAVLGGVGVWLASSRSSIPPPLPVPTPTPQRTGKPTGDSASFAVYPHYDPSGYMGDIKDIVAVVKRPGLVRFTYTAKGQRPHECYWKYLDDGTLNPVPCEFAGVLYLDPPNNWGTDPHGGFDLRGRHVLKWTARSLNGPVYVEFVIGGVTWMWNEKTHTRVPVLYPDSMPQTSLGTRELTQNWQTFTYDLSALLQDDLMAVVAGFGWEISWDSNGVQLSDAGTEAQRPKTFIIEIQGIAYER